jgi:proline dehydrogenase
MSDFELDLHDTAVAFADRSDAEMREKYRLFKLMGSPLLSGIGMSSAKFALSLGLPIEKIIKKTVFEQFCGGETIAECEPVIRRLGNSNIGTILDYSVEGKSTETDFDATKDEIIRTIKRAKGDPDIPFAVFKVTGIAPLGTLERLSAKKKLDAKSQMKCESISSRVTEICQTAHDLDQPVFIDAEDSWIQDAIDRIAADMMSRFNRERAIVFNTIQMYRKGRLDFLKESRRQAAEDGYHFAVKLVRGAYMEKERERAEEKEYDSPILETKVETDDAFDAAIEYSLKHYEDMSFVNATHNDTSVRKLATRMHERNIPFDHPHIFFSQLYGMNDTVSYVLASKGFNVSKYVPYGPIKDTIPYLIRRAQENTSVAGQMGRELKLIEAELKRRGLK